MNNKMTKQLLLSSNYWVLNKDMVRIFGLETAFLLSNFAEAENMMSDNKGWFYQTSYTVEKMTTLTRHKQDQCVKQLTDMGVLEKEVRGMPAKRYFKINYDCLTNLIVKNQQTRVLEINKQDCKKSATNKESSYKESNKESSSSDDHPLISKDLKKLMNLFESGGFGPLNSYVGERISSLMEDYQTYWVEDAMKVAIDSNVRKLTYVESILKRWKTEGKGNQKKKADDPYAGMEVY